MIQRYYVKHTKKNNTFILRIVGVCLCLLGLGITGYVFLPLILWNIFLAPVFASEALSLPIPTTQVVSAATIQSLLSSQAAFFGGMDSNNAENWFPSYPHTTNTSPVSSYTISIPKINISNAVVSTTDDDLGKHLVNFAGTCTPPEKGNCVIFGHSTLPQLFNPKDYHTIFANAHTLHIGDTITVESNNITYTYAIFSITVVNPNDTSVLEQTLDDSYVSLITCTPPGTLWKRLVIKARLEKL